MTSPPSSTKMPLPAGITDIEIDNVFKIWMLDKFSDKELFIIKHGARCFREFENNPKGVDGLRFCLTKFSNNSKQLKDYIKK